MEKKATIKCIILIANGMQYTIILSNSYKMDIHIVIVSMVESRVVIAVLNTYIGALDMGYIQYSVLFIILYYSATKRLYVIVFCCNFLLVYFCTFF